MYKNYIEVPVEVITKDWRYNSEREKEEIETLDTEHFWAVRPGVDKFGERKIGETEWEVSENSWATTGNAWRINGGEPVYVWSPVEIEGLRKLLDAIEAEMKEEHEDD